MSLYRPRSPMPVWAPSVGATSGRGMTNIRGGGNRSAAQSARVLATRDASLAVEGNGNLGSAVRARFFRARSAANPDNSPFSQTVQVLLMEGACAEACRLKRLPGGQLCAFW
jgi:hypothetical protein